MTETRSPARAGVQVDWVGDVPAHGVGGRQGRARPRRGGGGYLDECTPAELFERAKIRELADMGMPRVWIDVAQSIGFENFMRMWRVLDAAIEMRSESESMIELKLRRVASYQRYQRNRFIETLAGLGLTPRTIRERLAAELGETVSASHTKRLMKRNRIRS